LNILVNIFTILCVLFITKYQISLYTEIFPTADILIKQYIVFSRLSLHIEILRSMSIWILFKTFQVCLNWYITCQCSFFLKKNKLQQVVSCVVSCVGMSKWTRFTEPGRQPAKKKWVGLEFSLRQPTVTRHVWPASLAGQNAPTYFLIFLIFLNFFMFKIKSN